MTSIVPIKGMLIVCDSKKSVQHFLNCQMPKKEHAE